MRAAAVVVAVLIAGCDIPTELPKWNPVFAVPLPGTSIPVAQLVPISVESSPDGSTFVFSPPSLSIPYPLGLVCPSCNQLDGQTASVPPIQYGAGYAISFPVGLDSAAVVNGVINFRLTNGWSFDPLRPAPGQTGVIRLDLIGRDFEVRGFAFFSGRDRAFPPGASIDGAIAFAGPATQTPILHLVLSTPASTPVPIDAGSALTVTVLSGRLVATDATVRVASRQVTSLPMALNLTGVDTFIIRRVRGGKLILAMQNGFGVSGRMTLDIAGGINPVRKTFDIVNTDSSVEVELSEPELESILGQSVVATFQGFVSTSGNVLLMPTSSFTIEPMLVLELGPDS